MVEGRLVGVAGPVILALAIVALLSPIAVAEVNITVTPDAPQPVKSGLGKFLGLGVVVLAGAGVLALMWGFFKLATGQEGAGRWIIGGAFALIVAYGINDIVQWLVS